MGKFVISPHFRLHEWIAEEKGYFEAVGLEYEFRGVWEGQDLEKAHALANKVGAYQSFQEGRETNVSCACHWTVNVAASRGHGKMYADAYSVSPAAVFVPPESQIRNPEDLRGVPISVGYQSGSHYSTIQALEQYMPRARKSTCRSRTGSCSRAWGSSSTARSPRPLFSAAPTTSSSNSASARSSTPPS